MAKTTVLCFVLLALVAFATGAEVEKVSSSAEKVSVEVRISGEPGLLEYRAFFAGQPVFDWSPLGLALRGQSPLGPGFVIAGQDLESRDETYSMPHGASSQVRNHFNQLTLHLKDRQNRRFDFLVRAYDDGFGFQYRVPEQAGIRDFDLMQELSGFRFPGDHKYWALHVNSYTSPYEAEYTIDVLTEIPPEDILALPILVREKENVWVAITEAALVDYAGLYLQSDRTTRTQLNASLAPHPAKDGSLVKGRAPFVTPWRVVMLADNPGRLLESNLVLNFNQPATSDFSWVKPGLAINDWTSDHTVKGTGWKGAMDTRTMKHYIDFCADYGLEYMSIDAGWASKDYMDESVDLTRPIPEIDMPELVRYAKSKGLGIFLWTLNGAIRKQMDKAMDQFRKWGVRGLNIDFNNSDDQETVRSINEATRKAAEYQLMIEFHGVYKPTGLSRTYPNLLAHEAVLGLEYAKWDRKPTPDHNCILPFTRMLAGPMDYIVVGFTNATEKDYRIISDEFMSLGTRCHHLAQLVVFESGFQVLADYPDNYRSKTGSDFFRHVPPNWDETRCLAAKVGDFLTVARRKGDEWLMGSMTDWTPRDYTVDLGFLGDGDFTAEIYADGEKADKDANDVVFVTRPVKKGEPFRVKMAPGGGQAVRFFRRVVSGSDISGF